jgi:flagellar hook assembly protein FlgD
MEMMRPFEVMPCMGDGGMAGNGKVVQLGRASPQPFHNRATISYSLPSEQRVQLRVYNSLGREVKTLVDQPVVAGSHRVTWDATDNTGSPVAAGTYFYKLTTAAGVRTRKATLLR